MEFEFGGTGFSDFFEAFFGADAAVPPSAGSVARRQPAERGSDVEADIMVTLEEALHGSTRTVSLRRGGSKKVETYQVKIPRGVHEGQRIRLAGQGEAGEGGGKSGDLFLRVRLARASGIFGGRQRSHSRSENRAVAGGARHRTESADARRKSAPENSGGHARRPAFSFARARPAERIRETRRSLRRRANRIPKKLPSASARSGANWPNYTAARIDMLSRQLSGLRNST